MKKLIASVLVAGIAVTAAFALAQDKAAKQPEAQAPTGASTAQVDGKAVIAAQLPSYPLTKCVACGQALPAGKTVDFVLEGRLYRLCCNDCGAMIQKEPAKFSAQVDEAVIAAQKAGYPLQVCPVSEEKLGGMGEPFDLVHGTRLVRFCCKACVKEFKKDPAPTMAKVDSALIEQQKKTYPLGVCVVSGEALEGPDVYDRLYGVRLVRFCCKGCLKEFDKDPSVALAKIDAAPKK